jgi:hypothetical protein
MIVNIYQELPSTMNNRGGPIVSQLFLTHLDTAEIRKNLLKANIISLPYLYFCKKVVLDIYVF